jgi:hypothetical protein
MILAFVAAFSLAVIASSCEESGTKIPCEGLFTRRKINYSNLRVILLE